MAFVIGLGIGVVIALIARKRKKRHAQQKHSIHSRTEHPGRHAEDEELITVILPTISNNDKQP